MKGKIGSVLLATTVFLLAAVPSSTSYTYCVGEENECESTGLNCEQCHSLMWYVNMTEDILNDSVMYFFSGNHYLISNESFKAILNISNIVNITLKGNQSTVTCKGKQAGLVFYKSSEITIMNLEFSNCGANVSSSVQTSIFFELSSYLRLNEVKIRDSTGYGLYMNSTNGHITINNSEFDKSKLGNALFLLNTIRQSLVESVLKIKFCNFTNGGQLEDDDSAGLSIYLFQPHYRVQLSSLTIRNNTGKYGGNVAIKFIDFAQNTSQVFIEDSVIENGVANKCGGGLLFTSEKQNKEDESNCSKNFFNSMILKVSNTLFKNNTGLTGGGALITYHEKAGTGCTIREVLFKNCTFTENTAIEGAVMYVSKHELPIYLLFFTPQFKVNLSSCNIYNNHLRKRQEQKNEDGILQILSVKDFVISSTNFTTNNGTALFLLNSAVRLYSQVVFKNNLAVYGGAIKICESSRMYFNNDTRVKFFNNNATQVGGAIYVGNQFLQETPPCFYQLSSKRDTDIDIKSLASNILYFDGNHAGFAGHALYGGSVDHCFTDLQLNKGYYHSRELFDHIFSFKSNNASLITSDPYGVCECARSSNNVSCENRTIHIDGMYPGVYHSVYVSAVGQLNGTVPAYFTVYNDNNTDFRVYRKPFSKNEKYSYCKEISLTVHLQTNEIINPHLNVKVGIKHINFLTENSNYYKKPKLNINITILPCPFIFKLRKGSCKCPTEFDKFPNITCDITSQTFTIASYGVWISCSVNKTTNAWNVTAVSLGCKSGRCQTKNLTLSQSNVSNICVSDICVTGREGRLCGACAVNYSLSLGPSLICVKNSEKCSVSTTVLLVLVFILAGISMYSFVAFFNLTVAEGTINGFLLYVSSVYAILHSYIITLKYYSIFIVLFSWLNLEFGIEKVCFYAGMTAYQKIWLEFGFLLYLLLLGVMIVCLSRRFVWFTRLTGRNVVPVLATVAMLSHPKLIRLCFKVFRCKKLGGNKAYYSDGTKQHWMWGPDETIECFSGIHLVLFIFALVMFLIALLYTLCLLLIQCLMKGSGCFVLRWVDKMRPFFDAHTGPCHNHYRFWPGFLLFVEVGVYSIFTITGAAYKGISLISICVLTFFLACVFPKGVYKKWRLNATEFLFILNLITLSVISSLGRSIQYPIFGDILIVSALLTVVLIISFKKINKTQMWLNTKAVIKRKLSKSVRYFSSAEGTVNENAPLIESVVEIPPLVDYFTAPREELLYDNS